MIEFMSSRKNYIIKALIVFILIAVSNIFPINVNASTQPGDYIIISKNSKWNYEDSDLPQGDSWKIGNAPLGYPASFKIGNFGKISTGTLVNNNKSGKAIITYYFKKNFNLTDVDYISKLDFNLGIDDGVVLYINGKECYRYNMPTGKVEHSTTASSTKSSDLKVSLLSTELNGIIEEGNNEIAVEVHNKDKNSSDIYFDLEMKATYLKTFAPKSLDEIPSLKFTNINMAPGKNESELNFAWNSEKSADKAVVIVCEKSKMTTSKFPMDECDMFTGEALKISSNVYSNKATVTRLFYNTEYVYRVGDGKEWSAPHIFKTGTKDDFSFFFMGDPQIGASSTSVDTQSWMNSLNKAFSMFPNTNMIFSAGDQANSASEKEYSAFLSPNQIKSIPLATTQGNHDELGSKYNNYFNNPNASKVYGVSRSGSDYYFVNNNILFLVLDSNNVNSASHREFMKQAIGANQNVKWKIVFMHHSLYSSSNHSTQSDILNRRNTLTPIFESLGIDAVLMGHDHTYTRSYQMLGNIPQKNQNTNENGDVVYNPTGILYMTANTSTGSKYYSLNKTPEFYSAVRNQLKVPTFLRVNITQDSLEIGAYRTDNGEQFDSYTIVKK